MKRKAKKPKAKARPRKPAAVAAPYAPTDPVGRVQYYSGDPASEFNGTLVRVGDYHRTTLLFACYPLGKKQIFYLRQAEIEPLTPAARKHIDEELQKPMKLYSALTYDLRDRLASIGIYVKAESVDQWTAEQVVRIESYVDLASSGNTAAKRPKELK